MKKGSILLESVIILALAGVAGTGVHLLRPPALRIKFIDHTYTDVYEPRPAAPTPLTSATAQPSPAPTPQGTKPEEHQSDGVVREILADEAIALHKEDTPFLDARRSAVYQKSHIPGARSMAVWEADIDQKISNLPNEIPQDMVVVIYCSSGDCEDSHLLAKKLESAGYKSLRVFLGGFPEWTKRNLPVEGDEAK